MHSASDICQYEIEEIIKKNEGSANDQDDIIIWGKDLKELRNRTKAVMHSCRDNGLKLNLKKCQFEMTEITYLGHKINGNGITVDPKKCEAITKMKYPENRKELQRFLGSINYLGKFIPNLAKKTAILRTLLKKDVLWSFEEAHKSAVDKLKTLVTTSPILKFFDDDKATRVTCDASKQGLGCLLEQKEGKEWHPVAFGSRSLNPAELNYAPIELETLAVVFACKHFHEYLYGRQFIVQSDHQPLKTIFSKSITKSPPRLQRFMLSLQRYDFEVEFIRGAQNVVSDMFSRAPLCNNQTEIPSDEINSQIHLVVSSLPISDTKREEIISETAKDQSLQCLIKQMEKGWPECQKDIDPLIQPYSSFHSEISVNEGIVFKGDRVVIPQSMRPSILKILHQGHQGIENVKIRARSSVFWPHINSQITDMVGRCELCQECRNRHSDEPPINHEVPKEPWVKVGTDLFSISGQNYLLIIDYMSKYFDIYEIPDASAKTVVEYTKMSFSKFGVPKEVISDNGPCYDSILYKKFAKKWDFKHVTSSPTYQKSNGMAERTVQSVKKTIYKCKRSGEDVHLALLILRSTPRKNKFHTLGEILMKRTLRTNLPSMHKPEVESARLRLNPVEPKRSTLRYLPELEIGDTVRIYGDKSWSRTGLVSKIHENPRSYIIKTDNGSKIRRNRKDLLKVQNQLSRMDNDYPYSDIDEQEDNYVDNEVEAENMQEEIVHMDIENQDISIHDEDDILHDDENDLHQRVVTRSGRVINPPSYLDAYETEQ